MAFQNLDTGEALNEWDLNPSQERFWTTSKRIILFSGGFGCGKSLMLILKAIDLGLRYRNNFILMGRKTYVELRDTLMKEFFVVCPEQLIESFSKAEMRVKLVSGSEIIFRHLDTVAETELRSINLGAAFIDQAEDIAKEVFLAIKGRLRREGIADEDRKICMSINPELTWHFADFKQNPQPDYELIEASTLENKKNLPQSYLEDLMSYPESWRRQYVEGVWDETLLSQNTVFAREHVEALQLHVMAPVLEVEGLKVYRTFTPGHRYQMGIDVAEGSEEATEKKDKSSITIADLTTYEEVAHWAGQVPPDVVAEYAARFARRYQQPGGDFCTVIPEMNSIGLALVNKLKSETDILIYRREEFDKSVNKRLKKLGWRTTRDSKRLLVNHFQELLRKKNPRIHSAETANEFKTFIYSDESRKSGMAAKTGFHDDRIMSCLLSFFEKSEFAPGQVLHGEQNRATMPVDIQPTLIIDPRTHTARLPGLEPVRSGAKTWLTI